MPVSYFNFVLEHAIRRDALTVPARSADGGAGAAGAKGRGSSQLGWDSDNNNYYPGLDVPNDVTPKPEDYITARFRALSMTMVAEGTWRATSFAKPGVLKAAVKKLIGKPLFTDHSVSSVLNIVGKITHAEWQDAYKAKDGTMVPAGIVVDVQIDAKAHPALARNVLNGAVNSVSVTVEFDWEASHKFENDYEFERQVGNMVNDKMVCRVAVGILDFHELSLVWLGADPFAKRIDENGQLVNVDKASVYEGKYAKEIHEATQKMYAKLSFGAAPITSNSTQQMPPEIEKLIADTLAKLGLPGFDKLTAADMDKLGLKAEGDPKELTEARASLAAADTARTEAEAKVTALTSDVSALKGEKDALGKQVETLTAEVATLKGEAENRLKAARDKCKALYSAFAKGSPDAVIVSDIEAANMEKLTALAKSYGGTLAESLSGKCGKCGSTEISFGTTTEANKDSQPKDGGYRPASLAQIYQESQEPKPFL